MKKSAVLITGATGYLGSHLTAALLKEGFRVTCTVRPDSKNSKHSIAAGVETLSSEESSESLAASFRLLQIKAVLHLATNFISEHTPAQIPGLIQSNVEFGTRIAEAAALSGVNRFLNIGTFWQHYEGRSYSPTSLYAATKQAFETVLQYYSEARDLSVMTLKFAAVYGPRDPRGKIIGLLVDSLQSGKPLAMSPGEQLLDLVHVEDAVQAVISGMELLEGLKPGESRAYSVTSGKALTLKKLVETLETVSGKKLAVQWGAKPYRKREFFADWVSDDLLPNWQPKISLQTGLSQLVMEPSGVL